MLDVCLLGTGGMMPLPGRHLTACMVRAEGTSLLVDCGEGTQVTLRRQGWSFKPIDAIFFTHMHGDHVAGLPGLLLTIVNAGRTEPVLIYGPKGTGRVVRGLMMAAPELPFPVEIHEIGETEITAGTLYVRSFRVDHNVPCMGYRIELRRRPEFQPERARALGVPLRAWNPLQKGNTVEIDGVTYTPDMVLGEARKGLTVCYCTDTRPTPSIIEGARDADLFICEGMYGEEEKKSRSREYKHMTFREAAVLAKAANAKELWLTHFSPSLMHPQDVLGEAREVFANSFVGRERMTKILKYDETES